MPLPNTNALASQAVIGYGAVFSTGTGTGTITYTPVAEVTMIKPSGITVGEEEATNLGSPNAVKEYIPALVDNGTVEISGNYFADTTQTGLETLARARTIFPFQFAFSVGTKTETRTGKGFFTKYTPGDVEKDKVITFSATLRITGIETVADA